MALSSQSTWMQTITMAHWVVQFGRRGLTLRGSRTAQTLREDCGIEVGGGLGPLAGTGWRIGFRGHNAETRSLTTFLSAITALR
jgi:aspartate aminotransferase-like enzyme